MKCPKCSNEMIHDINLDYGEHSPEYCPLCGYAEECSNGFSEKECNRCTEYSHCKKWEDIKNGDKDIHIARCRTCGRKCTDINEYITAAQDENTTPNVYVRTDGTYDFRSNTFECTSCYVKSLM